MDSVVLLSGGLDSLVLLARERHCGHDVACLSFDYGQRHVRELSAAREIARYYGVKHDCLPLPRLAFAGSALTDGDSVPHAHYTDPAQQATIVPNRNMVMLSVALAYAKTQKCKRVLFAAHAGDVAIYPDCRVEFVRAIDKAAFLACCVHVESPFLVLTKKDIVSLGRELNAPLHLSWSCYEGEEHPCGKCGACVERTEALAL